jgi:cyclase
MFTRLKISIPLTFCIVISGSVLAQQDFADVEIRPIQLTANIYMLEGSGGNIGVSVGPDGILMIDDQFAPLAERIRETIEGLGEGGELKYVLNTHWHGDHTGGNAFFGVDTPIIAHDNVRSRLARQRGTTAEALPVITFDHSMSVHFNGEEIRAMHFPNGHTDGDVAIYFMRSNVAHLGDLFFSNSFPFIDTESGGSLDGLISNVAQIIAQLPPDVQIIPGHGSLSGLEDLRSYRRMLVESVNVVRQQMAQGKSMQQIQVSGLLDEWKSWGEHGITIDRWVETVYKSLSAAK